MNRITRRSFVKSTAAAAAAAIAAGCMSKARPQVLGANSDVRVGVIGFRQRGSDHISSLQKLPGVRITALCDVDSAILDSHAKELPGVETYTDLRKLLDSKNVDAVTIATPNHWHALATIWAIQAGKDVYVEKPVSHNVSEGRRMVEFARHYNRIVQTGTQSRSSLESIGQAVEYVRSGKLGKINVARGLCYKRRKSIGKVDGPQNPPKGVDLDLWTGPAEMQAIMRKQFHYDWHWFWNTGNGDLGNQGIHQMDVARWFLGVKEISPRILTIGGRVGYVDNGETPNTLIAYHDYADAPLIFEVRGLPYKPVDESATANTASPSTRPATGSSTKPATRPKERMDIYRGQSIGVVVECEGGYVSVPAEDNGKATIFDNDNKQIAEFKGHEDHMGNFIKAVRSRRREDLNADILEGHLSSALCHTSNISHRLGKASTPQEIKDRISASHEFTRTYERMVNHLSNNGVDINRDPLTLGMPLEMDPATERFIDNDSANAMLTRKYRAPYVVPQAVA